jgi:hypothetical protein
MYVIIGTINGKTISRTFDCVLDAMEYRDDLDAHYIPITFIKR